MTGSRTLRVTCDCIELQSVRSLCNTSPKSSFFLVLQLWYLEYPRRERWFDFSVIPLRFELLSSIMIPISLKVGLLFRSARWPFFHFYLFPNLTLELRWPQTT